MSAQPAGRPSRLRSAALVAVVALAASFGLTALAAAPASAAVPVCNSSVAVKKTVSGKLRSAQIPSYSTKITCQMVKGAEGREVKALQTTLKKCYRQYDLNRNLAVDGEFGPDTKQALKNAQTAVNKEFAAKGSA